MSRTLKTNPSVPIKDVVASHDNILDDLKRRLTSIENDVLGPIKSEHTLLKNKLKKVKTKVNTIENEVIGTAQLIEKQILPEDNPAKTQDSATDTKATQTSVVTKHSSK